MGWLLGLVTKNPIVLAYVAGIAFLAGLASGAYPAWKVQGWRLDAVHADFDKFKSETKAAGILAEHDKAAKEAADQLLKEKYDAENKRLEADNLDLSMQLLNNRRSTSYVPKASPGSSNPDRACFNRLQLEQAIRQLDTGVQSLITKGDTAIIGLDTARKWSQSR